MIMDLKKKFKNQYFLYPEYKHGVPVWKSLDAINPKSHEAEQQQAQSRQEQELKESQNLDAPAPPFALNHIYH